MRKLIGTTIAAAIVGVFVAFTATAQPGIGITKTAPLSGRGSSGDPLKISVCALGETYVSNGTSWACVATGGLPYTGGDGLTITAGDIDVVPGTGITIASDTVRLNLSTQDCAAGEFFDSNTATGVFSCVAEVGDISTVTTTANMGLTGGGTSGAVSVGLLSTCADGEVLKSGGTGTTWTCAADTDTNTTYTAGDALDLTGTDFDVNMTGASCSVGSYMSALSSIGGGTCTAEVGDISGITVTAPIAGAASSGSAALSLTLCSATQIYKVNAGGTAWECVADAGTTYTAGDGITLTASDFDLDYTSDFQITGGQLDLSPTVTAPGSAAVATTLAVGTTDVTLAAAEPFAKYTVTGNDATAIVNIMQNTGAGQMGFALKRTGGTTARWYQYIPSSSTDFRIFDGTDDRLTIASGGATRVNGTFNAVGAGDFDSTLNVDGVITQTSAGTNSLTGNLNVAGGGGIVATSYIQGSTYYVGSTGAYLRSGDLSFAYGTNAAAIGKINPVGYQEGATQFRSLEIEDGKGADIATFDGATKAAAFAGAVTVAGNATLGDANTDTVNAWGKVYYNGTAPTLTGCTTQCSMASYSTDARGRIICTDGSTAATCTVTFSVAYSTNPPSCVLQYENATADAGTVYLPTITAFSTSAFSFKEVVGGAAHGYAYHCDGML